MSARGENEGASVLGRGKGRRRGAPLPMPKTRAGRGSAVSNIDRASSNSSNDSGRLLASADIPLSKPGDEKPNGTHDAAKSTTNNLLGDHSDIGIEKEAATSQDNGMTLEELIEARNDGELTQEDFEVLKAGLEEEDLGSTSAFDGEVVAPSDKQTMTFEELLEARDGGDLAQEDFELLAAGATMNQLRAAQIAGRLTPEEYETLAAEAALVSDLRDSNVSSSNHQRSAGNSLERALDLDGDDDASTNSNCEAEGNTVYRDATAPESSGMSGIDVMVAHSTVANTRASPPPSPCSLNSTLDETLGEDATASLPAATKHTRKDEYGKATRIATVSTSEPSNSRSNHSRISSSNGVSNSSGGSGSLGSAVAAAAAAVSAAMTAAEEGEASNHLTDDNVAVSGSLRLEDVLLGSGMDHVHDGDNESGSDDAFDEDEEHRKLMAAMECALYDSNSEDSDEYSDDEYDDDDEEYDDEIGDGENAYLNNDGHSDLEIIPASKEDSGITVAGIEGNERRQGPKPGEEEDERSSSEEVAGPSWESDDDTEMLENNSSNITEAAAPTPLQQLPPAAVSTATSLAPPPPTVEIKHLPGTSDTTTSEATAPAAAGATPAVTPVASAVKPTRNKSSRTPKRVTPRRRTGNARREKAMGGTKASPTKEHPEHKREKLRQRVLEEIVVTERTYFARLEVLVDSFLEPLRSFIARDYEQRTGHRLNDPHDNSNNNNSGNNSGSNSGNSTSGSSTSGSGVGNGEDSSSSNGNNNGGEPSSPASGGGYFMGPPDGVNDLALVEDCFGAARSLRLLTKALLTDLEIAVTEDRAYTAQNVQNAQNGAPLSSLQSKKQQPAKGDNLGHTNDQTTTSNGGSGSSNTIGDLPTSVENSDLQPMPLTRPAGLGPVFLNHCDLDAFLEGYVQYTRGYKEGRHKLERLQRKYWFHVFVSAVELQPGSNSLLLRDFLIEPVQRVMRYRMLLAELLKYTPHDPSPFDVTNSEATPTNNLSGKPAAEEDADSQSMDGSTDTHGGGPHYQLTVAVARVEAVALKLNARMTEAEQRNKARLYAESWAMADFAKRTLLKDGPLFMVDRHGRATALYSLLFADLLVFGTKDASGRRGSFVGAALNRSAKKDVYRLKFSYPLRDCLLLEGTSAHSLQGVAALADLPPVTELAKPPAKRAAEVAAMPPPLAMPPRRRPSAASLVLALDTTAHGSNASAFVGGNSPQTARSDSSSSTTSSVSTTIDGAGEGSDIAASGSGGGDFDAQLRSIRSENERRLQASSERPRSVTAEGEVEEDCEAVNKRAVLDAKCWKIVSENGLTIDRLKLLGQKSAPSGAGNNNNSTSDTDLNATSFVISTPTKALLLAAASPAQRVAWVDALSAALQSQRSQQQQHQEQQHSQQQQASVSQPRSANASTTPPRQSPQGTMPGAGAGEDLPLGSHAPETRGSSSLSSSAGRSASRSTSRSASRPYSDTAANINAHASAGAGGSVPSASANRQGGSSEKSNHHSNEMAAASVPRKLGGRRGSFTGKFFGSSSGGSGGGSSNSMFQEESGKSSMGASIENPNCRPSNSGGNNASSIDTVPSSSISNSGSSGSSLFGRRGSFFGGSSKSKAAAAAAARASSTTPPLPPSAGTAVAAYNAAISALETQESE